MNILIKQIIISKIVKYLENLLGNSKKFSVNIQDDKDKGFTITIKVFDSINNVLLKASNTLAGLLKK